MLLHFIIFNRIVCNRYKTMMKQQLLILSLLITFCLACKKDNTRAGKTDTALTGTWIKPSINSAIAGSIESIEFSSNGDISINRYYVNPSTQQVLGYAYRYTGKYRITGNGLAELYNMKVSTNNTSDPYVAAEKLTNKGNSADQQYSYQLTNSKNTLSWTVICPPNADCIGTQQYTKQ